MGEVPRELVEGLFLFPPLASLTSSISFSIWIHTQLQPWPYCISDSCAFQNEYSIWSQERVMTLVPQRQSPRKRDCGLN